MRDRYLTKVGDGTSRAGVLKKGSKWGMPWRDGAWKHVDFQQKCSLHRDTEQYWQYQALCQSPNCACFLRFRTPTLYLAVTQTCCWTGGQCCLWMAVSGPHPVRDSDFKPLTATRCEEGSSAEAGLCPRRALFTPTFHIAVTFHYRVADGIMIHAVNVLCVFLLRACCLLLGLIPLH